jgi:hypothetical protein
MKSAASSELLFLRERQWLLRTVIVLAGMPLATLSAQTAFTRLAYLNLIGSYLTAAAQMNMAAGREVL